MLLIGIDLETTSLNTKTCEIVEIGIALYDANINQIIETFGGLVLTGTDFEQNVSGITFDMTRKYGRTFDQYLSYITRNSKNRKIMFAGHNALNFDKPIFDRYCTYAGFSYTHLTDILWIDSLIDVSYPSSVGSKALINLAAQHGFLNPFPHRAIFDVATMFKIIRHYDLDEIIARASTPVSWYRALVSIEKKDLAKELYYRWDGTNKFWVKQFREYDTEGHKQDAETAGFKVTKLPGYEYQRMYL